MSATTARNTTAGTPVVVDQLNHEWQTLARQTPPSAITGIDGLSDCATLDEVYTRLHALGTSSGTPGTDDEMLLALLHAHINQHCHAAGRVVLQRLLGRAVSLAQRAYRRSQDVEDIDSLITMAVAAVWDVIATYPLARRKRKVAANLAMDALHRFNQLRRLDACTASPHDPTGYCPDTADDDNTDAGIRLLETLAWGVDHDVITRADAQLLVRVYCPAPGISTAPNDVADELGMTRNTVRQRCHRAISRLAQAANGGVAVAA